MSGFSNPPLKRHASLQPLSRDHYVGLVQAQHLIKAADGQADDRVRALAEFAQAWTNEIWVHFQDEERLLPDLIAGDDARQRLLREHRALAALAAEAQKRSAADDAEPGADWVRRLGQMLNDHIRWEERELFPLIEQSAPPAALESLAEETARIEEARPRNIDRSPPGRASNADRRVD